MEKLTALYVTCVAVFSIPLTLVNGANGQVNVSTYHNDNARTGQNIQETVLTTSNVNASTFGQLFVLPLDGQVYAQPLLLSNVSIDGGTHNVVYVATEHDSVYAIDAGNGTVYWQKSFVGSGVTTVPVSDLNSGNCPNITREIGITGTPVIDSNSGTLYVVAKTKENGTFVQRLHALSVSTGTENAGWPVVISATGFDALHQLNRPGLLLESGHVVIAFGSHCDWTPYEGWVMSYNTATRAQEAAFNTVPSGSQGAVWMSGGGVASDANGNLYFATGNGTYGPNYTSPVDYGDSIVKLSPPSGGTFSVADWFTPHAQDDLNSGDTDLGSGGVLLLPDQPSGYTHKQLLVQMGKEGALYLVDRNGMGHYCSGCSDDNDTNIVQEIPNATVGVWGSPAYWNGRVYFGSADDHGHSDHVKAFSLYTTTPLLELTSQTPESFAYSTPTPSVSANGNTNGILWVIDSGGVLRAYDATNLGSELYSGSLGAAATKFSVPTVANGKVYLGVSTISVDGAIGGLEVYGLLSDGAGCSATLACHKYQSVILSQLTVTCSKYSNLISTSTQACTPDTGYPNNTHCGGYVNGPSGFLSSSAATAGVPPGNIQGPPSWCNYNYTIGTTQYQRQLTAQ